MVSQVLPLADFERVCGVRNLHTAKIGAYPSGCSKGFVWPTQSLSVKISKDSHCPNLRVFVEEVQNDGTLTIEASRLMCTKRSLLLNPGLTVGDIQSGHIVRTGECRETPPEWFDWPKPSVPFRLKGGLNNRIGARWPPLWTDSQKRKVFVKDCSKFKTDESHRLAQGFLNGTTGRFGVSRSKRMKWSDWRNRSLPDDASITLPLAYLERLGCVRSGHML